MRTVLYGAATSLDSRIAGPADEVDWLRWSDDVAAITATFWAGIDTVIMGRRTYEGAIRAGTTSYPGVRNIVCSRTLPPDRAGAVEIVSRDAAELVAGLKQSAGSGICVMGGGVLAASLFDAGLIDEVGVNVHPVLLGNGIPFLPAVARRVPLELIEARAIEHECVYLLYRVRTYSEFPQAPL